MCDLVYVNEMERLERQVLVERQIAATFMAAGAKDVEMPTVEDVLARFDTWLLSEPVVLDRRQLVLRRALGVA